MRRLRTVQRLEDYFDAVVFLTWSNWASEPRSNRYHYATRFARRLPTYFFQPSQRCELAEEKSGVAGLTVVNIPVPYDSAQVAAFKAYLREKGVRRPLLWVYNPKFEKVLSAHPSWFRVYHATEDYTIDEALFIEEDDQKRLFNILPTFDLLVSVSESVRSNYIQRLSLRIPSITLPNGCDFNFWRESRAWEFEEGADGPNVCLYQGAINRRLNFELLAHLADAMPDWIFAFCGRMDKSPEEAEHMRPWHALMERANVRHHGELSPERIAELAKECKIGIIPFVESEILRISLPLKAYEYVACGLPVVSVPITALAEDPANFDIASTPEEFAASIRDLAPTRSEPQSLDRRLATAAAMSYDERFVELEEQVCNLVNDLLGREKRHLNILMLHDDVYAHIKTIQEHLSAFAKHSRHRYFYLPSSDQPAWGHFRDYGSQWPEAWNFNLYDAIVWHFGMTAALPDFFSHIVAEQVAAYDGLKILFIQDEYESTHVIWDWIKKTGIQLVMTCVPEAGVERVYPPEAHQGVEFIQTLTGFVPEDQGLDRFVTPLEQRQKRIGYRGRILPYHYGSLGHDKYRIGVEMLKQANARGVEVDIEVDDYKRIYGDGWYRFLGSVRATLGTESGSNVFDFDGRLKPMALAAREAGISFEEFFTKHLAHREGDVTMNQVSPKFFEAIRLRTALICFRGEYSGILEADRHYIPLEKDFSNVDEVFAKIEDLAYLNQLTDRAYKDIIESGRYGYQKFVETFDKIIEHRLIRNARAEIFSAPIGYRPTGRSDFHPIVRKSAYEYILTDGVLCKPLERRDFEAAMAGAWRRKVAQRELPVANPASLGEVEPALQQLLLRSYELDQALEAAQRQVAEVLMSTSWRVTGPLRAAARWKAPVSRENGESPAASPEILNSFDDGDFEARQAALHSAELRLAALKKSTSWRITAPLRWMGRLRARRLV